MSRPLSKFCHHLRDVDPCPDDPPRLAALDRSRRLAALVAVGEVPLPTELASEERLTLLAEVARLRHAHLVDFLAHAIAADLHRANLTTPEADSHVETSF